MRMTGRLLVLAACAAALCAAGKPPAPPATGKGAISGVISPAAECVKVEAMLRTGRDPRRPAVVAGHYDAATGAFRVEGLGDGAWDLRLTLKDGGAIEGVDLRPEAADEEREFSDDDRKEILEKIANYPESFADIHRVLCLNANGKHAVLLVEKIRYRPFHSGKPGEQDWRVETWLYDYNYGGWVKRQHGWLVVARVRTNTDMAPDAFQKLTRLFDPKLGGIDVADGAAVTGFKYAIPEKRDMSMGKTPGSIEKQADDDKKKKAKEVVY